MLRSETVGDGPHFLGSESTPPFDTDAEGEGHKPAVVPPFEAIEDGTDRLAYIVRAASHPETTVFVTPPELPLQLGFIVYPADSDIPRHLHRPIQRQLAETLEVLIVRSGRTRVDFYSKFKEFVTSREVGAGDVLLLVSGGHGFHQLEDTVLVEVKQGPYTGLDEKERF